ncbi:hypothetical protein GWI33_011074, partial [Rhynchophorus ferrugineus]
MAHASNSNVQDVVSGGIGLAFIAFPKLISSLGAGADLFGLLFFGSLVVAGITSMVSILEVPISAFQDKLGWSRKKSVTIVAGGSAIVSTLLFSTHSAITFVDVIDHFANNIVVQSLRLPGAVDGLNAFFTPNWAAMADYKVWLAAYGHIFFSLSVGFAGIGVFAALGFMAHASNSNVQDVVSGGIGLAFIAFPKLISSLGAGADLFGLLFFGSLVVAGITSMVSILEVPISAFQDKLGWSRKKSVTIVAGGSAIVSTLLFSTHSAITFVDVIDHFANNIGIV